MIDLLLIPGGVAMIVYSGKIVNFLGPIDFAEKFFRAGGTNTFVKLVGLLISIFAFMHITGGLDSFTRGVATTLFPT